MAVDYDLVIIGGGSAARYAAKEAVRLKARVALVEPHPHERSWVQMRGQTLTQVGKIAQQMRLASQFGLQWNNVAEESEGAIAFDQPTHKISVQWRQIVHQAQAIASVIEEQDSPAVLGSLGIEVILGRGQFYRKPQLSFTVHGRELQANHYLIAAGSRPTIPKIEGLTATGYITAETIWQTSILPNLPSRLVIIGNDPVGVELAQALARLGVQVTLIVSSCHILPQEDQEAALLVQAQLEAEGVCILTQTRVTQVQQRQNAKWLQTTNRKLETDEILLATGWQPDLATLSLEAAKIQWQQRGIQTNSKLQTANSRVYACGEVLGGYQFAHIARHEADISLQNALFLPRLKVNYWAVPWAIFVNPRLARVGLTENQARQRYKEDVLILRQNFKALDKAQISGETTGFCKIVIHRNGEILGASIVGPEAEEVIGAIALAIQKRLKVDILSRMATISSTSSEILSQTAAQWSQHRLIRNTFLADCLEGWFNFRRS